MSPSRYVINFHDWDLSKASNYYTAFSIIDQKVKPDRLLKNDKFAREYWWRHMRSRPELYKKIKEKCTQRVLIACKVTKYLNFNFFNTEPVFDIGCNVIVEDKYSFFCVIQSSFHEIWSRKYGSTLETRLRYTNEDCFETYPFPNNLKQNKEEQLDSIGEAYHEHRKKLMLGMQLGLTKTYNLFHSNAITAQSINDKDKQVASLQKHLEKTTNTISFDEAIQGILKLRELHVKMDVVVLDAYGWNDIKLLHDFYEVDYLPENDRVRFTIHSDARKEVLKRLLELNHKIHEEEVAAGLFDKKPAAKPKKKKDTNPDQNELF
jgi:hypothetical protein